MCQSEGSSVTVVVLESMNKRGEASFILCVCIQSPTNPLKSKKVNSVGSEGNLFSSVMNNSGALCGTLALLIRKVTTHNCRHNCFQYVQRLEPCLTVFIALLLDLRGGAELQKDTTNAAVLGFQNHSDRPPAAQADTLHTYNNIRNTTFVNV